jgi:hypothetical protein
MARFTVRLPVVCAVLPSPSFYLQEVHILRLILIVLALSILYLLLRSGDGGARHSAAQPQPQSAHAPGRTFDSDRVYRVVTAAPREPGTPYLFDRNTELRSVVLAMLSSELTVWQPKTFPLSWIDGLRGDVFKERDHPRHEAAAAVVCGGGDLFASHAECLAGVKAVVDDTHEAQRALDFAYVCGTHPWPANQLCRRMDLFASVSLQCSLPPAPPAFFNRENEAQQPLPRVPRIVADAQWSADRYRPSVDVLAAYLMDLLLQRTRANAGQFRRFRQHAVHLAGRDGAFCSRRPRFDRQALGTSGR